MACAFHLQAGFRKLGHDADVVTFTRSGKPRITWQPGEIRLHTSFWRRPPDIVAKIIDAPDVLDGYDYVILSDVRTMRQDKMAVNGKAFCEPGLPDYVSILEHINKPFTTALHGNNYPPKEVQFAPRLLALSNFTGTAVTYSPTSPNLSQNLWPDVTWLESPLPYQMETDVCDALPYGDAVGITGRFIPNKGHQLLALITGTDRVLHDTELWGACSVGAGPSQTYRAFEALVVELGLEGKRYGNEQWTYPSGGDVIRPYLWDVVAKSGYTIQYKGPYEEPVSTCSRLRIHCDFTGARFSDGMEFSQFEAIDAGCLQVSVESMWNTAFQGEVIPAIDVIPGEPKILNTDVGRRLMDTAAEAINAQLAVNDTERHRVARHNRQVLADIHDPAKIATTFLRALQ
jgi:hypothetical protein